MSGNSLFYLDEAGQNPNVSNFWRDEAERKEKCFNFTHRCKSLNCFKPSVTWGEEFFNTWKQRLESSNMSDKKSWKLQSYLTVCSISCNQSFCFVVHAWRQRTSVSVIVSKKLMKFLPVSVQPVQQSGCPDHWRLQKMYLNLFFFFIVRLLTPQPGKALSYQMKVRFVRELGKAKWPSWTSPSPDCLFYSHYLSILNFLMRG